MDFVDVVTERRYAASGAAGMDWSTWDGYFRFLYNSSPILQKFVSENRDFYPDYQFAALGYIIVRRPRTGEVVSTWHAHEIKAEGDEDYRRMFGCPEPECVGVEGYPWVRTWVMEPEEGQPRGPVLVAAVEVPEPRLAVVNVRARTSTQTRE